MSAMPGEYEAGEIEGGMVRALDIGRDIELAVADAFLHQWGCMAQQPPAWRDGRVGHHD